MLRLKIDGLDKLQKELARLAKPFKRMKTKLNEIGTILVASIHRNFREGGRPTKWKPSKRALRTGGKTLIDTRHLYQSIHYTTNIGKKSVTVSTQVVYAAIHHFGGVIKTRFATIVMPARPFMLYQPNDLKRIRRIFDPKK